MAQSAVDGLRVSDIGGHRLRDGGWFRKGLVFRISGGLVGPAEIEHLDAIGLRVLVDLRGETEDQSALVDWAAVPGSATTTSRSPSATPPTSPPSSTSTA